MHGAGQESGWRAGTENVLEIVGLGKACEIARRDLEKNMDHMQAMRNRLYDGIKKECNQVRLNGHPKKRLPNTLSLSFHDREATVLKLPLRPVPPVTRTLLKSPMCLRP
jgi:cysteine desulfurase